VDLWCTYQTKQRQISNTVGDSEGIEQFSDVPASAKGIRQGPWGREEPHKKTGLFDHVADSIKWIRLRYQQSPPGVGFLEVGYVSGDREFAEAYCQNIIGNTWRKVSILCTLTSKHYSAPQGVPGSLQCALFV
jgi:hypothetical protein